MPKNIKNDFSRYPDHLISKSGYPNNLISILKPFIIFFICAILAGCATVSHPATERKEIILITSLEEVQIGRSMADLIITKQIKPLEDPAQQLFLNKIGQRLVQACDRRDIVYHFMILDSAELNAFALPGGYVYIYRGLLAKLNEAEIAGVLAHEIAHVSTRHAIKKMQSALGYDALLGLVAASYGNKSPELLGQIAKFSNTIFNLLSAGYGRQDELLADRLGIKCMILAGYDPAGLGRSLEILQHEKGPSGRVFEVLSDHSRVKERINKVKEQIKIYETNPSVREKS